MQFPNSREKWAFVSSTIARFNGLVQDQDADEVHRLGQLVLDDPECNVSVLPMLRTIAKSIGFDRFAMHQFGFVFCEPNGSGNFWTWSLGNFWTCHINEILDWSIVQNLGPFEKAWEHSDNDWQVANQLVYQPTAYEQAGAAPCLAHRCSDVETHNKYLEPQRICPFTLLAENLDAYYAKILRDANDHGAWVCILDNIAHSKTDDGRPIFTNETVLVIKDHDGIVRPLIRCANSYERAQKIGYVLDMADFRLVQDVVIKRASDGRWYCPPEPK